MSQRRHIQERQDVLIFLPQNSDANSMIVHNRDLALFRKVGCTIPYIVSGLIFCPGRERYKHISFIEWAAIHNGGWKRRLVSLTGKVPNNSQQLVGKINFYEADNTIKLGCEDSFDLDQQLERPTVVNDDIFADWLIDEQATQATSPGQSTILPFITPSSPSIASSSLSSQFSTILESMTPDHKALLEFLHGPLQHHGSTGGVSFYDDQLSDIPTDSYLQAPAWTTNLWGNSAIGDTITDVQFPAQAATTATMGPLYAHPRESSPYNMFGSPSSPLFIDPYDFSSSPTLVDAENPVSTPTLAMCPHPYPTRRLLQAGLSPFLSTSAPSAITPLSPIRSPGPSRSHTRRAQPVASDEGTGDPDITIQGIPERSQRSRDKSRSTSERYLNEISGSPSHLLPRY